MRCLVLSLALALAAAGPAAAETRALSGFTAINASEGVDVELTQGAQFAVTVDGAHARDIITEVRGDQLTITRRGLFHFGLGPDARVHVTLPRLETLTASSGVQISAHEFEAQRLTINLSQGAVLNAPRVRVGALTITASQGAQINIGGACANLSARAAMGAAIEADHLQCASAVANASMGGAVEIRAQNSVEANASMGGMIDVSGRPAHRGASTGMGGQIDFN